jgi:hypothetical protein
MTASRINGSTCLVTFPDYIAQHGLPRDIHSLRKWARSLDLVYETGPLVELHFFSEWNPDLPLATEEITPNEPLVEAQP